MMEASIERYLTFDTTRLCINEIIKLILNIVLYFLYDIENETYLDFWLYLDTLFTQKKFQN